MPVVKAICVFLLLLHSSLQLSSRAWYNFSASLTAPQRISTVELNFIRFIFFSLLACMALKAFPTLLWQSLPNIDVKFLVIPFNHYCRIRFHGIPLFSFQWHCNNCFCCTNSTDSFSLFTPRSRRAWGNQVDERGERGRKLALIRFFLHSSRIRENR